MKTTRNTSRAGLLAALFCVVGALTPAVAAHSAFMEPWSASSRDPIMEPSLHKGEHSSGIPFDTGRSLTRDFSFGWLRFYQRFLSPVGTVRCPMEPSCSRYSIQAINTHGMTKGIVMTADRLLHEADEKRWAMQIRDKGGVKYLDPLENNDFWWYRR